MSMEGMPVVNNSKLNPGDDAVLTPEELEKIRIEKEEDEMLAEYLASHPTVEISAESLRESEPDVAEFEGLIASFESAHDLAALTSITNLTPEESREHPVREPARLALIPIVDKLNALKKETNISSEKHLELKSEYERLSRAVGMINRGVVDHTR